MPLVTEEQRNVAHARLTGLGAWNGSGLLAFLAETSRKDSLRETLEPLRDLCERVRNGYDDGEEVEITEEEADVLEDLMTYQNTFFAKITGAPVDAPVEPVEG